ncbi:hypothetical protein POM88_039965 [Heracleum sosnowskyi]|uniref:Uncharacterized protein n=1 Tax=Heracleum sosnowskyi TaxID=360622 RepID=A0AAD8HC57_9APIA|nr:hypothetical protein POM88_039965 [Heracleum sosnowskyi]
MKRIDDGTLESFVWIQSADGLMQEVEQKLAVLCPTISSEMQSGFGYSRTKPITLPSEVRPSILSLVFHYCTFHNVPGRSYEEGKAFDENFLAVDSITLCELVTVAKYLQVEPLVCCACNALSQDILKTCPEVLDLMMNRGHDFPKANQSSDDSTCNSGNKLSNSLSPKMKKEVKEKKENPEDSRSVDDLVSFINGEDTKEVQSSKKKKKNRKKRQAHNNAPSICASSSNTAAILKEVAEDHVEHPCSPDAKKLGLKSTCSLSSTLLNKLKLFDTRDEASTLEEGFDDSGFDRVVEDFDRKINLSWDDRKREMHSESERVVEDFDRKINLSWDDRKREMHSESER